MNRINPLHIIALLVVIALFVLFKLSGVKTELADTQAQIKQKTNLATELVGLKKIYGNKKQLKREIEKILRLSAVRQANIEKRYTKSGVSLQAKSIGLVALNTLMGKLLNGAYNITKLKVKKLSDKKAMVEVEIKW